MNEYPLEDNPDEIEVRQSPFRRAALVLLR